MIESVELAAADDVVLRGQLELRGEDAVLLLHEPGRDLDAWGGLHQTLAAYQLSVLALDLAGHGGSEGTPDPCRTTADAVLAGRLLRQRATGMLFVGAAGTSAAPALRAAEELRAQGFFVLDPVFEELPRLPTLAILPDLVGREQVAARLVGQAGAWAIAVHVPVAAAGLDLLWSDWAENVRGYITTFLSDLRATTGNTAAGLTR
jgi:pimeloyl-ACP methyl ester carboxylesterase